MSLPGLVLYPLGALLSLSACAAYVWFLKPAILVRYGLNQALKRSGLKVKYVQGKKYRFCYAERGKPSGSRPSLLLLHGFSGSKDMFVPLVKYLPADLHMILMDLPGHGETTIPSDRDPINLKAMCEDIKEFVDLCGLASRPFHLAGSSLGGIISASYAIDYIKQVERLSLICPAVETPVTTPFLEEVRQGDCKRLIPETVEEMSFMLNSCFYKKHIIPNSRQILQGTLDLRKPKNSYFLRLSKVVIENKEELRSWLEGGVKNITCPTQLVWGKEDELIHVSGADYLKGILPNVERVDLFDKCGHTVTYDQPRLLAEVMMEFRGENNQSDKKNT